MIYDTAHADAVMVPKAGWQSFTLDGERCLRLIFNLCGLDPSTAARSVEEVANAQARRRDFVPLFLTDDVDLGPLMRSGFSFERLPSASDMADFHEAAVWTALLERRVAHIVRKWGISQIVNMGAPTFTLVPDEEGQSIRVTSAAGCKIPLSQVKAPAP